MSQMNLTEIKDWWKRLEDANAQIGEMNEWVNDQYVARANNRIKYSGMNRFSCGSWREGFQKSRKVRNWLFCCMNFFCGICDVELFRALLCGGCFTGCCGCLAGLRPDAVRYRQQWMSALPSTNQGKRKEAAEPGVRLVKCKQRNEGKERA